MKSKPTSMRLQPCYFGLRSPIWKQIKKQFCLWCLSSLAKKVLTMKIWTGETSNWCHHDDVTLVARKNLYSPPSKRIKQHGRQSSTNRTKHTETLQDEEGNQKWTESQDFYVWDWDELSFFFTFDRLGYQRDSIIQTKTVSCFVLNRESFSSVPSSMQKSLIES